MLDKARVITNGISSVPKRLSTLSTAITSCACLFVMFFSELKPLILAFTDSLTFSLLDFELFTAFVSRTDSVSSNKQATIITKVINVIDQSPCNLNKHSRFVRCPMLNEEPLINGQRLLNDSFIDLSLLVINRNKLKINLPRSILCYPWSRRWPIKSQHITLWLAVRQHFRQVLSNCNTNSTYLLVFAVWDEKLSFHGEFGHEMNSLSGPAR